MEKKRLYVFSMEDENDVNIISKFAIGPVNAWRKVVEQRLKSSGSLLNRAKFEKILWGSLNEMVILDCENKKQESDNYHTDSWHLLQQYMGQL